jgi:hypothetical protein
MEQSSDDGLCGPLGDFNHSSLRPALAITADYPCLDAVFMQDRPHFIGRQIDISLSVVTDNKPMTIPVTLDGTLNLVQRNAGFL